MLTGDRPTGALHLGHYVGSLKMRVELQEKIDTFVLIADLHVLTTRNANLDEIGPNIRECVLDYLAVGIDPEKSTIYLQSLVPEVLELLWLFMPLVSVPRAQRIPTLKEQVRDLKLETASMALLSYPVLQSADILMVRGDVVPVGKDQASHVELTREIARRFNQTYADVFPEPDAPLTPVLVGTDGQTKASKSVGNVIMLSDPPDVVEAKVRTMFTDPKRIRADIPGTVEGNPVFIYHEEFNDDQDEVADLADRYRQGKVGDVEVKTKLAAALNRFLDPIRDRRETFAAQKGLVEEIIEAGSARAREECHQTLEMAREAMGLTYFRGGDGVEVSK
ncbi:MAG: tryptophan--tRNA ligase [Chloroflexi bacterium]|nr:tryptophan--tRNA ligase [Chloroflexota bacterium]MCI0782847.1 tryptophan--tRNA ligase [Chloroflexota bacterium]MCI0819256.1 tryptophan--tRNA ligase [Chloroflexota bacterium]MCI0838998.1 tryptophan--tRNA ligase [Chloroflexota bacterium]MCI0885425.1 tryptophan--tRNA ligase [Chloroflexota bacterium]